MSVFVKIVHFVTTFFKLCVLLGMDITFSKTTAHKLEETPGGRYAKNPRWPPLETEKAISPLLLALQPCVIPVYLCFSVWEIRFWSHFKALITFSGLFCHLTWLGPYFPMMNVMLDHISFQNSHVGWLICEGLVDDSWLNHVHNVTTQRMEGFKKCQ